MASLKFTGLNTIRELIAQNDLRYVRREDEKTYSISRLATAESGFAASYKLIDEGGAQVGETINIPKDYLVRSAELKEASAENDPVNGMKVGDKYIDFVINTSDDSATDSSIYLPVNDLVDAYVAGHGIEVSASNEISIKIDSTNANGLSVGANGLAMAVASGTQDGILTKEDFTRFNAAASSVIVVGASTGTGNVVTSIAEVNGELVANKSITALQESDLIEITAAEVKTIYEGTPTPTPTKYTVTFNSNEGSPVDPQEVEKDGKVTKPADPTKDGHTFGGWFSDSELTAEWNFETGTVSGAMTLYAKWDATP